MGCAQSKAVAAPTAPEPQASAAATARKSPTIVASPPLLSSSPSASVNTGTHNASPTGQTGRDNENARYSPGAPQQQQQPISTNTGHRGDDSGMSPSVSPVCTSKPKASGATLLGKVNGAAVPHDEVSNSHHSTICDSGSNSPKKQKPKVPLDPLWKQLYGMLPHPVDPADVPAVIADWMARTVNLFHSTEILLIQRKVRGICKSLPRKAETTQNKVMGRFLKESSSSQVESSRILVEKHHLLDEFVLRKLWPIQSEEMVMHLDGRMSKSLDLVGAAIELLLHFSESLSERTAAIALHAAQTAGLEMDVNKQQAHKNERQVIPAPPSRNEYSSDVPLAAEGVSFHGVCFFMGLALRGTRVQRLQLLFYLLMPRSKLRDFCDGHPAGGIPTWLLEVDNKMVISVASMTHYYYFGETFLPTGHPGDEMPGGEYSLQIASLAAMETLGAILSSISSKHGSKNEAESNSSKNNNGSSPERRNRHKRSSDLSEQSSSHAENGGEETSVVMEYLHGGGGTAAAEPIELDHYWEICEVHVDDEEWTMDDFCDWANDALDDNLLDTLMYRVFANDVLPSPVAERDLVLQKWQQWQQTDIRFWSENDENNASLRGSSSFQRWFHVEDDDQHETLTASTRVWGGIGGFDGRGGLGYGIMYCIDKTWWDSWESYVGWNWDAHPASYRYSRRRPGAIASDRLLDVSSETIVGGMLGSFQVMRMGVMKGKDYVVIPPGVWDVLYELYGGGPPLPRMVLPPPIMESRARTFSVDSKQMEDDDVISVDATVEIIPRRNTRLRRIPDALTIATHPWVFHCHVCDAQQPYRRGDAGPMSIRVMATPDQPLSRLYAQIIVRLPIHHTKAMDKNGRGQARLWRQIEPSGDKDPQSRYGPWSLLCKNRSAILPIANLDLEFEDNYKELKDDWRAYADHATVEGIGLVDGDRIMLEYAVQNKAGTFVWPREAAAKASRMRRLADDELKFRRLLRGVDEDDKPIAPPPILVGMAVDAMDVSGRWFETEILEVQIDSRKTDEEKNGQNESVEAYGAPVEKSTDAKQVRIDFAEFGGHEEWIDVESDRLATAGRFSMGIPDDGTAEASPTTTKNGNEAKPKVGATLKKATSESPDQTGGKVCPLPGFGACGLANLGNTCYANSAIQCMSYMPMLRSYLLSAQYKATGDLNKDNPLGTGGKLLEEFAELLRVMWSGRYGERSPTRFRAQLGKARSQFSGGDQQDAQEFLNYILDVLHEDSNKIKEKPYVEALEDDWVKSNTLPTVGEEAWRRFLRRNRSVMADVAMGQVLNTVTCPVCDFSSRNFDPFNLLSLPFPTVADVIFLVTVVRRGTPTNTPRVLNRPRKGEKRSRFDRKKLRGDPRLPPDSMVIEQYAIAMSRLADIGDLKLRLQNICGISAKRVKLCTVEEIVNDPDADDSNPIKKYTKVTALPDKNGPCVQVAKSKSSDEGVTGTAPVGPTRLVAFESTLRPRQPLLPDGSETSQETEGENSRGKDEDYSTVDEVEEDDSDHYEARAYSQRERKIIKEQLKVYGDKKEGRIYDTDPLALSKAMSRSLWPESDKDFKLGLRVDAIDHRDHWFPGSVVEVIEGVASEHDDEDATEASKLKVLIHFDNFSAKWDETYTIDHFTRGQVRPLYSHSTPRVKPTEFLVYHRYLDRKTKKIVLFGHSFYLQCEHEWSTARAGAHILGQAARFLQRPENSPYGPVDVDEINDSSVVYKIYDKAQSALSELIDLLIEYDRAYVTKALGISDDGEDLLDENYRNPDFDDSNDLSPDLVRKAGNLLHKLPFEVRVCTADMPLSAGKAGTTSEECPFPFSLIRTIGNYMNPRHAIVLHWRDPPADKKYNARSILSAPVMYSTPPIAIHKSSTEVLNESKSHASKNNPGSGGMHLSVCLQEFCKTQKLDLSDCWRCPRCKDFREGEQHMDLWRLPDLLTFHIKRFNCSARWREKITTKVNFPLTGLDMSEWCHSESPSSDTHVYDLIGVMNHYGGMTGGHYVAVCKATACSPDGSEEVAYSFPGTGTNYFVVSDGSDKTGWRLGRKEKDPHQSKVAAATASKYVSESAEPLWLQFDDELVEPIPPRNVVSETAYVLFYRRRQLTPANIAKYSTLE